LLIVGDGIREGVETIAEYLQQHLGLNFSLGLVEMPVFHLPSGGYLVTPRVLARTVLITRQVVALPEGFAVEASSDSRSVDDRDRSALSTEQKIFWSEFLSNLTLGDPEHLIPRAPKLGYVAFMMPAPNGSSWITAWRDMASNRVGLTLGWTRGTSGEAAGQAILEDWPNLSDDLGGEARIVDIRGRTTISEAKQAGDLQDDRARAAAFAWLQVRLREWVNVFCPSIRSIVLDMTLRQS